MTEKTATKPRLVLAILADMPKGVAEYLSQVAAAAGWEGRISGEEAGEANVRLDGGQLVFSAAGKTTAMKLPLKASRLVEYLQMQQKQAGGAPSQISIGTYTLHTQDYLLVDQEGTAIRLTEKETAILICLSQQEKGQSVTRQALLDAVWAYAQGVETHTLETHIYRLRQKIEADPANPKILLTLEDGYRLGA